jgi:hypothetical protein
MFTTLTLAGKSKIKDIYQKNPHPLVVCINLLTFLPKYAILLLRLRSLYDQLPKRESTDPMFLLDGNYFFSCTNHRTCKDRHNTLCQ